MKQLTQTTKYSRYYMSGYSLFGTGGFLAVVASVDLDRNVLRSVQYKLRRND